MKTSHKDVLITVAVTIVIIGICIMAIFGLPTDKPAGRTDIFKGVAVDTIQNEVPLLDMDVKIPVSVPIEEDEEDSTATEELKDSI